MIFRWRFGVLWVGMGIGIGGVDQQIWLWRQRGRWQVVSGPGSLQQGVPGTTAKRRADTRYRPPLTAN